MTEPVFVFGASGHAGVIVDILERAARHTVAGLIDSRQPRGIRRFGYSILGDESGLRALMKEHRVMRGIVAIGDNFVRAQMAGRIRAAAPEFEFIAAVHPSAQIARDTAIGPGAAIMAAAVVNTGALIGAHCIVNTKASVDHDSVLEDFSSLGPGATLGGNVRVGESSVVAIGACVTHGRTIGRHALLGAGAVLLHDLPEFVVAWGVPARVVRERQAGERYL